MQGGMRKSPMAKIRYGVFGGTYDPIHLGHLIGAQTALEALNLDKVLFLLSAHPPHKEPSSLSPYQLRRQMVQLAIQDNPAFEISELETRHPGTTYTVLVLNDLYQAYPPENYHLILIIGADNLREFNHWKQPEKILQNIPVAVLARPGFDVSDAPTYFHDRAQWVQMPYIDISSTDVRNRMEKNLPIRYLVPPDVEQFIHKMGLYQPRKP
jgi:nicotinate-nucleotide adenylyltransferase